MIPTTRFLDYNEQANMEMAAKVKDFAEIFKDTDKLLSEINDIHEGRKKKPVVEVVEDTSEDNSLWIDPSIVVEFVKRKDEKAPVHIIIDVYERWFEQLYKLTTINKPVLLKRKKLFKHMVDIFHVCVTFRDVLAKAAEGIPEGPAPTKPSAS